MSELISGKDVVLALLEGKDLLWKKTEWEDDEKEPVHKSMWNIEELLTGKTVGGEVVEFYLKPRTITINGIEVPAPFEPKEGGEFLVHTLTCKMRILAFKPFRRCLFWRMAHRIRNQTSRCSPKKRF